MMLDSDNKSDVLLDPNPAKRRQSLFLQAVSALFCITCGVFTLVTHAAISETCKKYETEQNSRAEMQHQVPNPRTSSFTRLTIKETSRDKYGCVQWVSTSENLAPSNTEYLTLSADGKSLEVCHNGTYRLFLQITYRHGDGPTEIINLRQDIFVRADRYPSKRMLLLTSMETVNFNYWRKSLFTEGIFYLEAGDKLMINANLSFIDAYTDYQQKNLFVAYPAFYI